MKKNSPYNLRPMTRRDLKQVLQIERQCFLQPYSKEIFIQELRIKAAQMWVAVYRKKIFGYIDFWMVTDEMELVSIAVQPKHGRKGVGKLLMRKMIKFGREHKINNILLDVRTSNLRAQNLYRKFGFKKVGLRKRYYSDNQEDAIIMRKEL